MQNTHCDADIKKWRVEWAGVSQCVTYMMYIKAIDHLSVWLLMVHDSCHRWRQLRWWWQCSGTVRHRAARAAIRQTEARATWHLWTPARPLIARKSLVDHRPVLIKPPQCQWHFYAGAGGAVARPDFGLALPSVGYYSMFLHCALASCGAVYCNRSCLWVGGWVVCLCVCGSVTTIARNCVHRSSPN